MTDIVYPYKESASRELEFSLKSLKNVEYDRVFIVTDDVVLGENVPNVHLIKPLKNGWARYSPYNDVINKLLTICDYADEIVLMNDDIFIMAPDDMLTKNRGLLVDHLNVRKYDTYARALQNTRNLLSEGGYDELDYELHTPMRMNTALLRIAITELLPKLQSSRSIMIRSYYGNRFAVESDYAEDVKNAANYKDLNVISTNEMTFAGEIGDYIKANL